MGRSERRIDGPEKVLGTALYGADLFHKEADYFACVVRSHEPHANIVSIDPSAALRVHGVLAVYTAKDMIGTNRHGLIRRDHPVLAEHKVLYRGDAIAIVVAETERAARQGRDAVRVEYECLPVVGTIDDALTEDAPRLHPNGNIMGGKRIRKGDADKALEESDAIVSDTFQTQTVDHAFLDLEAGIGRWDGNVLTLHVSGQWVHEEQRLTALALGLPIEAVRIINPVTGGAFGGREDLSIQVYLGLAAIKNPGKTIAMRYSREESMRARHKRHALRIHYTLGAKKDGTFTAAKVTVFSEEGAYASSGPAVLRKAASHATGPYRVPHVYVDVYGVFTNNNPTGAMRGFGAAQIAVAYEGVIDRMAARLGMDRVEIRRKNLVRSGDAVTTGQVVPEATPIECLDAAVAQFRARQGQDSPLGPNQRRGWGVSAVCFGLGYGDAFPDASRASVKFSSNDRLEVWTGGVEYGQGLLNMVGQIAAEELGVPMSQVDVVWADTARTKEAGSTSATRQTYFTGNAVKIAACELRDQVLDIAGKILHVHPNELDLKRGKAIGRFNQDLEAPLADILAAGRKRGYSLEGNGIFRPRTVCEDFDTGQSPLAFITYLFGTHISQVVVDVETGEVRVERHIACHDVGKAINPQGVRGQLTGGAAQGISAALMEEVVMQEGRMMNPGFTDYILPTIRDIPPVECVILEHDDPGGPFGARGVGEPPLIGATPAVISAIADALGVFPHTLPCNPQRVWELLHPDEAEVPPETRFATAPPHARMTR
ncbi:MAG TPA: xanthine dehydrogenase family protein molybdopterin-binding subunit [Phycisphaerae bacterium]|nr:xanthine dehydrogenase family protein molybdopterin-binding subunit [Phycisphaerae bacterium]